MHDATAHRYRMIRRIDPYMTATSALWAARATTAAERAGIPPWTTYLSDEPVTIDGRDYLLTVEPDADAGKPSDHGDCYGEVFDVGDGYSPTWPTVRDGDQSWAYYPGDTYEPVGPYRPGMAKGPAREAERAMLVREGWRYHHHRTGETPMFYVVTLTAADDPTNYFPLGGVDGLDDETFGRAYLWDVVQDLAAEVSGEAVRRAETARQATYATTAHG